LEGATIVFAPALLAMLQKLFSAMIYFNNSRKKIVDGIAKNVYVTFVKYSAEFFCVWVLELYVK
jgi:hypothetical protein